MNKKVLHRITNNLCIFLLMIILISHLGYVASLHSHEKISELKIRGNDNQISKSFILSGVSEMIQTTLLYGISDSTVNDSKGLPLPQKIYFFIHHSIFVQMSLLFIFVSVILFILHYNLRQKYNEKFDEIITRAESSKTARESNKYTSISNELNLTDEMIKSNYFDICNCKDDTVIKIDANNFDQFLNRIDTTSKRNSKENI